MRSLSTNSLSRSFGGGGGGCFSGAGDLLVGGMGGFTEEEGEGECTTRTVLATITLLTSCACS